MATLPIGFFLPLPLPIMIPFMMWQSAAIATGFGTMFQYSKRKISAMSNEEFNALNPVDLINQDLDSFIKEIPSSFNRIRSVNMLILSSMSDFLVDAIRFLSDKLGGQLNQPFSFTGPPTTDLPNVQLPQFQNPFVNPLPQAFPEVAPPQQHTTPTPDQVFNPNIPSTPEQFVQPINARSRVLEYMKKNPMPQGPKSDPKGWHFRKAIGADFATQSGAQLKFSFTIISNNTSQRRASQSSNLNYSAIKKKLAFYASVFENERTKSVNLNESLAKQMWDRMILYARAVFDWRDFYIGTK